jgi:hypothetical protein
MTAASSASVFSPNKVHEEDFLPSDAPSHVRQTCAQITAMTRALSGSSSKRWFDAEHARPLPLTAKHGEAGLEERSLQTVKWLFALFNVMPQASRVVDKHIALEFTTLVEQHYVLWQEFETSVSPLYPQHNFNHSTRKLAFAHEVIYKASLLWMRLQDMLFLQCRDDGNIFLSIFLATMLERGRGGSRHS